MTSADNRAPLEVGHHRKDTWAGSPAHRPLTRFAFPYIYEVHQLAISQSNVILNMCIACDVVQVLSLSMLPFHGWGRIMSGVSWALHIFHLPLYALSRVGFYPCLAVCAVITVLLVLHLVYTVTSSARRRAFVTGYSEGAPLSLRIYCIALLVSSTYLFVPIVQNFLAISVRRAGASHLAAFPDVASGSIPGVVALILTVVSLSITSVNAYVTLSTCIETNPRRTHSLRRCYVLLDVVFLFPYRFLSCVLAHHFRSQDQMMYFDVWMAVASFGMAALYMLILPYYQQRTNQVRVVTLLLACAYSILSAISEVDVVQRSFEGNSNFDLLAALVLLPLVTFVGGRYVALRRVSKIYSRALASLERGVLTHPVVHFPKNLPREAEYLAHYNALLRRIESAAPVHHDLNDHEGERDSGEEDVPDTHIPVWDSLTTEEQQQLDPFLRDLSQRRSVISRFIVPYVDTVICYTDLELATRFLLEFRECTMLEPSGYQYRYAATILLKGVSKYPSHTFPCYALALLLLHQVGDARLANEVIHSLRRVHTPWWMEYQLWRLQHLINLELHIGDDHNGEAFGRAKALHRDALRATSELWQLLLKPSANYKQVNKAGSAVLKAHIDGQKQYRSLLAANPCDSDALACYTVFSDHVLCDSETCKECLQSIHLTSAERNNAEPGQDTSHTKRMATAGFAKIQRIAGQSLQEDVIRDGSHSRLRTIFVTLFIFNVLSICLFMAVIATVAVSWRNVKRDQLDLFFIGKLRALTAQISFSAKKMQTTTDDAHMYEMVKHISSYMADFSSLHYNIIFGAKNGMSDNLKQFFRRTVVSIVPPSVPLTYWSFMGTSLAAMQDVITRPNVSSHLPWLVGSFNTDGFLAMNRAGAQFYSNFAMNLSWLQQVALPLLCVVAVLQVVVVLLAYYGLYLVEGTLATAFALFRLVPMKELKRLHMLLQKQRVELDRFFAQPSHLKTERLLGASPRWERDKEAGGIRGKCPSLLTLAMADGECGGSINNLGSAPGSSIPSLYSCSTQQTAAGSDNGHRSLTSTVSRWTASPTEKYDDSQTESGKLLLSLDDAHHAQVSAVEQMSLLLHYYTHDPLYRPGVLILLFLVAALLLSLMVISSIAVPYPLSAFDYYKDCVVAVERQHSIISPIYMNLLDVTRFTLSGKQRYFRNYVTRRAREKDLDLTNVIVDERDQVGAVRILQISELRGGLQQIMDIVMRLACTTYEASCRTPNLDFQSIYLSDLAWGSEDKLIIAPHTASLGMYNTVLGVLEGSALDLAKSPEEQLAMAKKILSSDLVLECMSYVILNIGADRTGSEASFLQWARQNAFASAVLAVITALIYGFVVMYLRRHSRSNSLDYMTIGTMFTFIALITVTVVSIVIYFRLNQLTVGPALRESADAARQWCISLFKCLMYPSLYLGEQQMKHNALFAEAYHDNTTAVLGVALVKMGGSELLQIVSNAQVDMERLLLISMVLIYEVAKDTNSDALALIFDDTYLNNYTWDFLAEPDHLLTEARYGVLDGPFYTTREADLAQPNPEKMTLAANTLFSNRLDATFEIMLGYLPLIDNTMRQYIATHYDILLSVRRMFLACAIVSGTSFGILVLALGSTFFLYVKSFVRLLGDEVKATTTRNLSGKQKKTLSGLAKKRREHRAQRRPSDTSVRARDTEDNTSAVAANWDQGGTQIQFVRVVPFVVLAVVICLTISALIALPIGMTKLRDVGGLTDTVTRRRWLVAQSMYIAEDLKAGTHTLHTTREKLHGLYNDYIEVSKLTAFGPENTSGYALIGKDKAQDTFLFSRNDFYALNDFVGMDNVEFGDERDVFYVVNRETAAINNVTKHYYCSSAVQEQFMKMCSRGVGLMFDEVWPSLLRRIYTADSDSVQDVLNDMEMTFEPLMRSLAESDDLFYTYTREYSDRWMIFLVAVSSVALAILVLAQVFIFYPFVSNLLSEDARGRRVLLILPTSLRDKYHVSMDYVESLSKVTPEKRLTAVMMEMASLAVVATDAHGIVIRFNSISETLFDYDATEVIGQHVRLLIPDDSVFSYTEDTDRFGRKEMVHATTSHKVTARRRNGQLFPASLRLSLLDFPNGEWAFVGYLDEIPDTEALKLRQNTIQETLEMTIDGIIIIDHTGIMTTVNPAIADMLGYEREELIGKNVKVLMLPADAASHDRHLEQCVKTGAKRKVNSFTDISVVRKDGSVMMFSIIVKALQRVGQPPLFFGYLENLSRQHDIEAANLIYETALDLSPVPILVTDERGTAVEFPKVASETYQWSKEEVLSAPPGFVQQLVLSKLGEPGVLLNAQLDGGSDGNEMGTPIEVQGRKRDGTSFPALLTRRDLRDSGLRVSFIQDISSIARLEQAGDMANAMLEGSAHPIIVVDRLGDITFANVAAATCFHYTRAEIVGLKCSHLLPPDATDDDGWEADGGDWPVKRRLHSRRHMLARRNGGEVFPAEVYMSEVPPNSSLQVATIIYLRELTDEQKTVQQYHVNEQGEAICPLGIIVVSASGTIERLSAAAEEGFGYTASEVLGANIHALVALNWPRKKTDAGDAPSRAEWPTLAKQPIDFDQYVDVVRIVYGRRCDAHIFTLSVTVRQIQTAESDKPLYVIYCDDVVDTRHNMGEIAMYREIYAVLDTPLAELDSDGIVMNTNASFNMALRYQTSPVVGMSLIDFLPAEVAERFLRLMASLLSKNADINGERGKRVSMSLAVLQRNSQASHHVLCDGGPSVLALCGDGTAARVHCRLVNVTSEPNKAVSFLLYLTPSTGHQQEESFDRFNNVVTSASLLPMVVCDHRGFILKFAQSAAALLGFAEEEVIGTKLSNLLPDAAAVMHDSYLHYRWSTGESAMMYKVTRVTAKLKDGRELPVEVQLAEVRQKGLQPLYIVTMQRLTVVDYPTNTRHAQRIILDGLRAPAVVTNREGVMEDVSTFLCDTFGYQREELIGKDVSLLMMADDAKYHRRHIASYFKTRMRFALDNVVLRTAKHKRGHPLAIYTYIKQVDPVMGVAGDIRFIGYLVPEGDPTAAALTAAAAVTAASTATSTMNASSWSEANTTETRTSTSTPHRPSIHIMPLEMHGRRVRRLDNLLVEEAGLSFVVMDGNYQVLRLSKAAEVCFGCTPTEVVGRPLGNLLHHHGSGAVMQEEVEQVLRELQRTSADAEDEEEGPSRIVLAERWSGEGLVIEMRMKHVRRTLPEADRILRRTDDRSHSVSLASLIAAYTSGSVYVVYLHNITEQLESRRLKALLDGALNLCQVPTVVTEENGVIHIFNPAAEKCFGWTAAEARGQDVAILTPALASGEPNSFIQAYLQNHGAHLTHSRQVLTAQRKDGTQFPATVMLREVTDPSAHFFIVHLINSSEDYEDVAIRLLTSSLLKDMDGSFLLLDRQGELLQSSPTALYTLQYQEAELQGQYVPQMVLSPGLLKLFKDFLTSHHLEEGDSSQHTLPVEPLCSEAAHVAVSGPQVHLSSVAMQRRDGSRPLADINIRLVLRNGQLLATLLHFCMASAGASEAAGEHRVAVESVRYYMAPYFVLNRIGQIVLVNQALATLLGYPTAEEAERALKGQTINRILPRISLPEVPAAMTPDEITDALSPHAVHQHEYECRNILDGVTRDLTERNLSPFQAQCYDGSTIEVRLETLYVLHSVGCTTTSAIAADGLPDLHYFAGELSDAATAQRAHIARHVVNPLLQQCELPMLITDATGTIVEANAGVERVFNFRRDQLLRHKVDLLSPHVSCDTSGYHRLIDVFSAGSAAVNGPPCRVMAETRTGQLVPLDVAVRAVVLHEACLVGYLRPLNIPWETPMNVTEVMDMPPSTP